MKKIIRFSLIFLLLISIGGCNNSGGSDANINSELQSAVDDSLAKAPNRSGISVAVYKKGTILWTYAAGSSDRIIPMTTSTPTFAYSITKTFISALVLTQVQAGLYQLTDTLQTVLSGHPDYGSFNTTRINVNATIGQLLNHTSGIQDYAANISGILSMCDPAYSWKPANIVNLVTEPYKTGNPYQYSNTNYILLGMIAQYKGGSNLNTLLKTTFFNTLGINAVLAPQDSIPVNIAHPFDNSLLFGFNLGFVDLNSLFALLNPLYNVYLGVGRNAWAAGAIVATAEDLARWGWELYDDNGKAIAPAVRTVLKNSAGGYGYGVETRSFTYYDGTKGLKYGHDGSAPGYHTLLRYESTKGISIAIITNTNNLYGMGISVLSGKTGSDSEAGLVDREELANELLNILKSMMI